MSIFSRKPPGPQAGADTTGTLSENEAAAQLAAEQAAEGNEGETEEEKKKREDKEKEDAKASGTAPAPTASTTDATGERARIGAILNSAEGKANPAFANFLAFEGSLSAEDAIKHLKAAGPAVAAAAATGPGSPSAQAFRAAMNNEAPNPKVGAGAGGGADDDPDGWHAAAKSMGHI